MIRRVFVVLMLFLFVACDTSGAPPTNVPSEPTSIPTTVAQATTIPTVAPTSTPQPTATPSPTLTPTPTPQTTDTRTGRPALVRGALTQRPYVVMIDNAAEAYPQTGLDQAAVVFEALAEFGITRYMAVFAPDIAAIQGNIGPVRSARIYFVQWAMGFRAVYIHAGGSPAGIERLQNDNDTLVIDIDYVDREENYGDYRYHIRSGDRPRPHNLYTNEELVKGFLNEYPPVNLTTPVTNVGFLYEPEKPITQTQITRINYAFLDNSYAAGWRYNAATNEYARVLRGAVHVDAVSGEQLTFKSVVVMQVNEAPIVGDPKGRIDQEVIGEGNALVFKNGTVTEATWRKASEDGILQFFDAQNQEIKFPLGPLWIAAVPYLENVSYQ